MHLKEPKYRPLYLTVMVDMSFLEYWGGFLSINWHIEYHDCINSTQDFLRKRIVHGASEGLVIRAGEQSSGYGRHGRVWVSSPGNLFVSFLLKPDCNIRDVGQLALVVGLSLGQAVHHIIDTSSHTQIKWPNDVLIDGLKCAGILIEVDSQGHVIVGVGGNILCGPEGSTFLQEHTRTPVTADIFLKCFLDRMNKNYTQWIVGDFETLKIKWLELAHPIGASVGVKIGSDIQNGIFHGLDHTGAMLLKTNAGTIKTITAGDVFIT